MTIAYSSPRDRFSCITWFESKNKLSKLLPDNPGLNFTGWCWVCFVSTFTTFFIFRTRSNNHLKIMCCDSFAVKRGVEKIRCGDEVVERRLGMEWWHDDMILASYMMWALVPVANVALSTRSLPLSPYHMWCQQPCYDFILPLSKSPFRETTPYDILQILHNWPGCERQINCNKSRDAGRRWKHDRPLHSTPSTDYYACRTAFYQFCFYSHQIKSFLSVLIN